MLPTTICAGMESRLALPCRLPTYYVLTGYSLCAHFVQAAHRAVAVPRPPHALPACQQAHLGRTRPHTRPRALRRTARGASQPSYSPPNHIPHPLSPVTFLPNPPSLLLPFPPRWLSAHPSDLARSHPISSHLILSHPISSHLATPPRCLTWARISWAPPSRTSVRWPGCSTCTCRPIASPSCPPSRYPNPNPNP